MIRLTRSRRHLAALASTALAAGALAVLPGVAGLSTASAAPTELVLDYTCNMTRPGVEAPVPLASKLTVSLTPADVVTAGESFETSATATLEMDAYMGPVTFTGSLDLALSVGGKATTAALPITAVTPGGSAPPSPPPHVVFAAPAKTVTIAAPDAAVADAPVTIGNVLANLSGTFMGQTVPSPLPCTPDDAPTASFGTTDVEAAPAGVKYTCKYQAWTFPAYLTTASSLPASVNEDTALNPAMTGTLIWGRYWSNSSRNINMTFQGMVADLATSTSGKAGTGTLSFADPAVPATGAMTWGATGSYGAVDTTNPGSAALSYGNLTLKGKVRNNFTGGQYLDATIPCTAATTTAMGTVAIADVAEPPVVTDLKVTGVAKIKGVAKVGKKLTAVPGKAAGAKITYKWFSNGNAIKKATGKTLKLTKALKGKKVTVKVTYAKAGFNPVTQTSKAVKVKK